MTTTTHPTDEEAIRLLVENWAEAVRTKNAEQVDSYFTDDAVRYYLAPPLVAEGSQKELAAEWYATFKGGIGYEILDLKIHVGGDIAYSTSLNHMSGARTDGTTTDLWVRETMGFRKHDDHWCIAHEHESVPFLMDGSDKAALDLKP